MLSSSNRLTEERKQGGEEMRRGVGEEVRRGGVE